MKRCECCGQFQCENHGQNSGIDSFQEASTFSNESAYAANSQSGENADDSSAAESETIDDIEFVAVAYFHNAAEAGFFSYELTHQFDIPTRTHVQESFDALSGTWSSRFALCVPIDQTEAAASAIRRHLDGSDQDAAGQEVQHSVSGEEPARFSEHSVTDSGVSWIPIVLTLTAGSFAFWGMKKIQMQPKADVRLAPHQLRIDEIWDRLGDREGSWVQKSPNGRVARELIFDRQRQRILLREDRDGDGRFEQLSEFSTRN